MLQRSKTVLLLICLGIIIPVFFADASISWSYDIGSIIFEKITDIQLPDLPGPDIPSAKGTANAFLLVIFGLLHVIGLAFLAITGSFLGIVNSPDFIGLGYTQNNPFVIHGWTLVRDLSNMFFILFLVFIALGSTLRIKEYEVKKILPTLIGIAILINFTPVICGFIIDASNIIMNTFLNAVGPGIEGAMKTFIEIFDVLKDQVNKSGNPLETLGFGIGTIIFVFISAFVFFTFAILFFIRYAALWILIILSPIAFLCYILPQTKKVWLQWWNQFIQWCFVGVLGAFFLYLGEQMLGLKDKVFLSPSEGLKEFGGMDQLLPFIIPIIILIIGFFATIKTSAIGADRVMAFSQGVGKKAYGFAKQKTKESAFVKGQTEQWRQRLEGLTEKHAGTDRMKAEREMKHRKNREERTKQSQELQKNMSVKTREKYAKTPEEKLARFRLATEEEHLDDTNKSDLEIIKALGTEKDISDALKQRPDWAGENIIRDPKYQTKGAAIIAKVQGTAPIKLRQNTDAVSFKNEFVVFSMNASQIKEVTERGKTKQKENIYKTYADEIQRLTGIDMTYNSQEELRKKIYQNRAQIQAEISFLRKGNPEEASKAEAIKEITLSIQKRKF